MQKAQSFFVQQCMLAFIQLGLCITDNLQLSIKGWGTEALTRRDITKIVDGLAKAVQAKDLGH